MPRRFASGAWISRVKRASAEMEQIFEAMLRKTNEKQTGPTARASPFAETTDEDARTGDTSGPMDRVVGYGSFLVR